MLNQTTIIKLVQIQRVNNVSYINNVLLETTLMDFINNYSTRMCKFDHFQHIEYYDLLRELRINQTLCAKEHIKNAVYKVKVDMILNRLLDLFDVSLAKQSLQIRVQRQNVRSA